MSRSLPSKLHLGCGDRLLDGWLNADIDPAIGAMKVDAARRFPFEDDSFDAVFTEHMIEHLTFWDACRMLGEARRVLRPKGVLRVATPDLAFLIDLYAADEPSPLQEAYTRWANEKYAPGVNSDNPLFVLNNFMRNWGHKFIWDAPTLESALGECGFEDIGRCAVGESPTPGMSGLENLGRMPEGFLELETMVFEARAMKSSDGDIEPEDEAGEAQAGSEGQG